MDKDSSIFSRKQNLYIFLSLLFLTNALIAELIGAKIFSLEKWLDIAPAQLKLPFEFILDFNLTAGVMIWPVVFITSDLLNEYFGIKGLKRISYLTAGFIAYSFLVVFFGTTLPPANFWLELNKILYGNSFDINESFTRVFRQGLGIMIGSIVAFVVGQIVDTYVFHYVKGKTGDERLWLRATGSTLISQFIDSFIVLFIAFYVFGNWPLKQIFAVGLINYIYKFCIAVILTPLLYPAHKLIDNYLEKDKKKLTF